MEETLDAALRVLFGDGTGVAARGPARAAARTVTQGTASQSIAAQRAELARQTNEHFDRARAAQRADDWATYGTEMQRLGEVLRRLRDLRDP
jgi:uncharacterized membrane protein (UPF0182 family)